MMLDNDAMCGNLDSSSKFLQDEGFTVVQIDCLTVEMRKRGNCNYQWSLIVEIFAPRSTCMFGVLSVMVTAICRCFLMLTRIGV